MNDDLGTRADRNNLPSIYISHVAIIAAGFFFGLLLTFLSELIPLDFSGALDRARELGIVSISTLLNYPKSRDSLFYFAIFALPILCALTPWYLWARGRMSILKDTLTPPGFLERQGQKPLLLTALLLILFVLFTYDTYFLYSPNYISSVGSWQLLGEEGAPLAWAHSILSGGSYGKEFFCLYGPLLPYSLAAAMKVFGQTVVAERGLKYCLDLIAFGLVAYFLVRTVRSRLIIFLASFLYVLIYLPVCVTTVNFTTLRFVLGIMPLLMVHLSRDRKRPYLDFSAGVVIGVSLLFSQEAGLVSLLVSLFSLFLQRMADGTEWRDLIRRSLLLLAGLAMTVLPVLGFLAIKSGLPLLWESVYGFARIKTLGYGAMPFPSLHRFISAPLNTLPLVYWMIVFYGVTAVYLIVKLIVNRDDKTLPLKMALLLYGIILMKIPMGRPAVSDAIKVFHPALLLLALQMDGAIFSLKAGFPRHLRIGRLIFLALTVGTLAIAAVFGVNPEIRQRMGLLKSSLGNTPARFARYPLGVELPMIDRGGVYYSPGTAESIVKIGRFIATHARDEKYLYFFPNEALYYFLFDKMNPTRYAISYFAATLEQRRELVSDLERNRPRYVVYSNNTWRVDGIPEAVQVPEVVEYLVQHYGVASDLGGVVILERRDP